MGALYRTENVTSPNLGGLISGFSCGSDLWRPGGAAEPEAGTSP